MWACSNSTRDVSACWHKARAAPPRTDKSSNNARAGSESSRLVARAAASPAIPGPGRGPRRARRSRSRAAPRNTPWCRPPRARGCFRAARKATGSSPPPSISAVRRRNDPGGVAARGRPAESSTATSHRRNSAPTRRARPRSGVIRAAVRSGVSNTWRMARAMTPASSIGSAQSIRTKISNQYSMCDFLSQRY